MQYSVFFNGVGLLVIAVIYSTYSWYISNRDFHGVHIRIGKLFSTFILFVMGLFLINLSFN